MYIGLYKTPNKALSCFVLSCHLQSQKHYRCVRQFTIAQVFKNSHISPGFVPKAPSSTSLEFQIIELYNSLQSLRSLITPLPLPPPLPQEFPIFSVHGSM